MWRIWISSWPKNSHPSHCVAVCCRLVIWMTLCACNVGPARLSFRPSCQARRQLMRPRRRCPLHVPDSRRHSRSTPTSELQQLSTEAHRDFLLISRMQFFFKGRFSVSVRFLGLCGRWIGTFWKWLLKGRVWIRIRRKLWNNFRIDFLHGNTHTRTC